jgi:hypothetical protein
MLKQIDDKITQGRHINFTDDGYLSPGSKTRKFTLTNRFNGAILGYVKWIKMWYKYGFFPVNTAVLEEIQLEDIKEFIIDVTVKHRAIVLKRSLNIRN